MTDPQTQQLPATPAAPSIDDAPKRKAAQSQTTVLVVADETVWLAAQRQGKQLELKLARELKLDRLKTGMQLAVCTGVDGEGPKQRLVISRPIAVAKHWHETEDGGYVDARTLCAALAELAHPASLQVWTGNPGDGDLGRVSLQGG